MSPEQPSASPEEREALAFLRRARKLRGLTPAHFQRIERRLEPSSRPRRRPRWRPALVVLFVALVAGTAVAGIADLSRLPLVGTFLRRAERPGVPVPAATVKRPAEATARAHAEAPAAEVVASRPEAPPPAPPSRPSSHRAGPVEARTDREGSRAGDPTLMALGAPQGRAPAVRATLVEPVTSPPSAPAPIPEASSGSSRRAASASGGHPADPLTEESRSFSSALARWHRDHDAEGALEALDAYDRRFPRGQIQVEARILRAEVLLSRGREGEGLAALDQVPLSGLPRGRELATVRGELRVKHGRCVEGRRDLSDVLAKGSADGLGRRAARAIRLCP